MKKRLLPLVVLLILAACGTDGGSPTSGGTANDGDCPEKDAMISIQEDAEDPYGPGGSDVTDEELAAIQAAIAAVPSDC